MPYCARSIILFEQLYGVIVRQTYIRKPEQPLPHVPSEVPNSYGRDTTNAIPNALGLRSVCRAL